MRKTNKTGLSWALFWCLNLLFTNWTHHTLKYHSQNWNRHRGAVWRHLCSGLYTFQPIRSKKTCALPQKQRKRSTGKGKESQSKEKANRKSADTPDSASSRRAFTPLSQPGFQLPNNQTWSPFDLFSLFFSMALIATIVKNTNDFAAHLKLKRKYLDGRLLQPRIYLPLYQWQSLWEWLMFHLYMIIRTTITFLAKTLWRIHSCIRGSWIFWVHFTSVILKKITIIKRKRAVGIYMTHYSKWNPSWMSCRKYATHFLLLGKMCQLTSEWSHQRAGLAWNNTPKTIQQIGASSFGYWSVQIPGTPINLRFILVSS